MLNDISQLLFIVLVCFSVQCKEGNIRLQAVQYPTLRMFMYPCTRKKEEAVLIRVRVFSKRHKTHLKSLWIQFTLVHQGQLTHLVQVNKLGLQKDLFLLFLAVTFNGTAFYTFDLRKAIFISNLRTCKPINEMCGPLSPITPEVSI